MLTIHLDGRPLGGQRVHSTQLKVCEFDKSDLFVLCTRHAPGKICAASKRGLKCRVHHCQNWHFE